MIGGELLGARVTGSVAVSGGSINAAYRVELSDGRRAFVKTLPSGTAPDMYAAEADGLRWLAAAGAVRVPEVWEVRDDRLVLEWIEPGRPAADHDAVLGRSLAALHAFGAPGFGHSRPNYVGSIPQDNTSCATWSEFYALRRLQPLARLAGLEAEFETVLGRLCDGGEGLAGPPEPPARLHGDLWSGNVIADRDGRPVLVDPSVYGGHREVDLAMMRLFGGFGADCFDAYHEVHPLVAGHAERVDLYQLYPLLVHVVLFGGAYRAAVLRALAKYR